MDELKKYKFASLYKMSSGISSKPEQAGHGAPFLSFSVVFNNRFIPDVLEDSMDTSKEEQEKYSIKEGDIFLTRTSETKDELGMSCAAIKDYISATYSGFLKRLRPTQNNITYGKYMAFYLRGDLFRKTMNNNAIMTLRASLNEKIFSYLDLMLPSYDKQKRIGDFLYSIYQKIELNNRINTELEAMAKLLYDYWFVQFDFPNEEGKPYKSSGGEMVYNERLKREIPKGWEVKILVDFAKITTGKLDSNAEVVDGKYPFFTCASMPTTIDHYAYDDTVILIAGNNAAGNFHINRYKGKFNAYQRTYIVTAKNEFYLNYLYQVLKRELKALKKRGKGSQTKFLTLGMLTSIKIFSPSKDVMEKFHQLINPLYEKQVIINKENQELTALRDWLLPMLMNGQVQVE